MKNISNLILIVSIAFLLTNCGKENNFQAQLASLSSNICDDISGAQSIYWDLSNGVIRTDLPGGIPPTVNNIGGVFSHDDFPLLGFSYPEGWTPEQLSGNGTVGVNLFRNNNQGIWRSVAFSNTNGASLRQIRDAEISAFMNYFGLGTTYDIVCDNMQTNTIISGINVSTDNLLLQAGNMTAIVITSLTYGSAIPISQANVKVAVAPTNEFNEQVWETFLAIEWQFLFKNPDSLNDGDSDDDGTPDAYDNFPFDPTRS